MKRLESPELIERLRQAAIDQNARQPNAMKGTTLSEDKKQHLREATKKQFSTPEGRKKHLDAMKKWMTPEMRKQISDAKKGVRQTDAARQSHKKAMQNVWDDYTPEQASARKKKVSIAVVSSKAKMYKGFVSPEGIEHRDVYNLSEFCRNHGLSVIGMCKLNLKKISQHKGWTLLFE